MGDIQQWRRKVQPPRVRTPAADLDDGNGNTSPVTPRKPLRPKFTPNLAQHQTATDEQEHDHGLLRRIPSWITDQPAPNPKVDELIGSMMRNVLDDPYSTLTARYTSDLMQIFEDYRAVRDEKQELLAKLDVELQKRRAMELAWSRERDEYKAEVKRLEVLLSKGQRGIAEVTLARQDSLVRRGKMAEVEDETGLETILKHLEKSKKYEEKAFGTQRGEKFQKLFRAKGAYKFKATMRNRSPSSKMRRLSRTLAAKTPATTEPADSPYGTLPAAPASILQRANRTKYVRPPQESERKASISDTSSSFSGAGDLLPDEIADLYHSDAADDHEMGPTNRRFNQSTLDHSAPKLLEMSSQQALRKTPSLRTKASGFLARWKPQLSVDTRDVRRFSFEAEEDGDAYQSAPPVGALPAAVRDRLLRKSASMSSLEARVQNNSNSGRPLTPIAPSPTTSAPRSESLKTPSDSGDPWRRSKIPTPVHQRGSLARARRDRDDSSSSLLTVIRRSDEAPQRTSSLSSSAWSSPSGSRVDMTQGPHAVAIAQGSSQRARNSNNLLEHTTSLRGKGLATAAARTAAMSTQDADRNVYTGLDQQFSSRVSNNSRGVLHAGPGTDDGMIRKENRRPMR
ncbi:uncharacterized protein LTR77_003051 [Saxophila tyrrhenica]|uniref:Uncharacterized protein n=1 Tax=Saxophila tyrrhenica TaxID=1690608 RepID=A0AAV9PGR1_9PEZI|nr:hypothetical protein LTR77_003051 [Saxophila tyrrhenica]